MCNKEEFLCKKRIKRKDFFLYHTTHHTYMKKRENSCYWRNVVVSRRQPRAFLGGMSLFYADNHVLGGDSDASALAPTAYAVEVTRG